MKLKFVLLYILAIALFEAQGKDFYPQNRAEKLVRMVLKDGTVSIINEIAIENAAVKELPLVVYECTREESGTFYAVLTQAKGRYDRFDYLLILNAAKSIERVRVLKYRSEHGGEIGSKKWLKQFENYSSGELRYKHEISAISGATLSAKSITNDIRLVMEIVLASLA